MKYAENINGIIEAFGIEPLEENELAEFYQRETMAVRTGEKTASPIEDIFEDCKIPAQTGNSFLFLGHRGCGKSTELNEMSVRLKDIGYPVYRIDCFKEMDMNNPQYTDLLILMGDALLNIAKERQCTINEKLMKKIQDFWTKEITESGFSLTEDTVSAETGVQAKTPWFLSPMIEFFAHLKGNIKYSEEKRSEYKEIVSKRSGDWLRMMNTIADEITEQLDYKHPIVIFEDIDKMDPQQAWDVFSNYAGTLTGFSFPVVYTFPIALAYAPRFAALKSYFQPKTLPMIKQKDIDGNLYEDGKKTVISIVKRRARLEIFDEGALELMIEKTGGSLRDLFSVINSAARLSRRQRFETVSADDARYALTELRTELWRRIESKHYNFLAEICNDVEKRKSIADQEMLLEMMLAGVVLEYNGKGWHDVHPLIADFLRELGRVN